MLGQVRIISLEPFGQALDRVVDRYLVATDTSAAAEIIRANPALLTPVAARTVLALTDPLDRPATARALLLYRSELHGLAQALRNLVEPTSERPARRGPEMKRAIRRLQGSRTPDEEIDRLRAVRKLAGYADLNRGDRRTIEMRLGDQLLARYRDDGRLGDLDEALVMLRRAFCAEQRVGTADAWGEAELERYLVDGDPAHLSRADELIRDVVAQPDTDSPYRTFTLVNQGRVMLELHRRSGDVVQLNGALLAAESAVDSGNGPAAAAEILRLAEDLISAAARAEVRDVEAAADCLRSAAIDLLGAGRE